MVGWSRTAIIRLSGPESHCALRSSEAFLAEKWAVPVVLCIIARSESTVGNGRGLARVNKMNRNVLLVLLAMSLLGNGVLLVLLLGRPDTPTSVATPMAAEETSATSTALPTCLLYTSPSPRDRTRSRMPSSA